MHYDVAVSVMLIFRIAVSLSVRPSVRPYVSFVHNDAKCIDALWRHE